MVKTKHKREKRIRFLINTIAVLTFILIVILGHKLCDWLTEPKYCTVTNAKYDRMYEAWEITIRDQEGNHWAYYDDFLRTEGTHLYPVWDGATIVGIKLED